MQRRPGRCHTTVGRVAGADPGEPRVGRVAGADPGEPRAGRVAKRIQECHAGPP